ncbi:fibronectin type III domain-containing protein [Microbacterium caowuchunii]|nr:fibronectin type III domain-containing protein [Microbacterium caowuchunii]
MLFGILNIFLPDSKGNGIKPGTVHTASPGGKTTTTTDTRVKVTGLSNGTAYTFTVTATNTAGTSPASTPTAKTTPKTG